MRRSVVNGDAPSGWLDDEAPKPVSRKSKIILDLTLAIVFPFCMWAGWFELERALNGVWRGWVYAFEWPVFGFTAIWLWRRLRRGDIPRIPSPDDFGPKS